jgi:anti-sigma regulatory factor (Ser/Thr protein kinase)
VDTNEAERLRSLRSYKILDTDPEQAFDDLTLIASQICGAPIALITLVDEDRQWFKSRIGTDLRETPRSISFCAHAIQQKGIFTVPDASIDARFKDNPVVKGNPHIRFYAGAPIESSDGQALGTLCVIDYVPRALTPEQNHALQALERQVAAQMELRRNLEELRIALHGIEALSSLIPLCSSCEMNVVIPADATSMEKVTDGLMALLKGKNWPENRIMEVHLAAQEAIANAIRHGCKGDATKQVQCAVSFDAAGELVIVVRDPGTGFDPKAVPNPLEGNNLFKGSGRGVFLINELMDTVEYEDEGRMVKMRKARPTSGEVDSTVH